MKILFSRLVRGYWKGNGQWVPAILTATVDGHKVRCVGNGPGWDCNCEDPDCGHVDAVADLVLPSLLEVLEAEDDTHHRPAMPGVHVPLQGRPRPSHRQRKRRTSSESEAREDVA